MINGETLKPTPDNGYRCPVCDGRMTLRKAKRNTTRFYGCLKFPDCNGSRNSDGTIPKYQRGAKTYFFEDNNPWETPDYDLDDNWGIELQDTF